MDRQKKSFLERVLRLGTFGYLDPASQFLAINLARHDELRARISNLTGREVTWAELQGRDLESLEAGLASGRIDPRTLEPYDSPPPKGLFGSEFWPDGPECLCYPEAPGCLGPPCLTVPHREGLVWGTKRPYLQLRRHILHSHLLHHGPSTLKLYKRLSAEEREHVSYHGLMQDLDVVGIRIYEAPRTWKAKPGCRCGVSYRDLMREAQDG